MGLTNLQQAIISAASVFFLALATYGATNNTPMYLSGFLFLCGAVGFALKELAGSEGTVTSVAVIPSTIPTSGNTPTPTVTVKPTTPTANSAIVKSLSSAGWNVYSNPNYPLGIVIQGFGNWRDAYDNPLGAQQPSGTGALILAAQNTTGN